jgi:hypothetical protein
MSRGASSSSRFGGRQSGARPRRKALEVAVAVGGLLCALAIAGPMVGHQPARAIGGPAQYADVPVAHGCRGPWRPEASVGSATSTAIGSSGNGSVNSKRR